MRAKYVQTTNMSSNPMVPNDLFYGIQSVNNNKTNIIRCHTQHKQQTDLQTHVSKYKPKSVITCCPVKQKTRPTGLYFRLAQTPVERQSVVLTFYLKKPNEP